MVSIAGLINNRQEALKMITQEQLISDIKLLPDSALQAVAMLVKEMITLNTTKESTPKPIYGSGRGKMRISNDFDAPLEELREYMQ
jgi:hypothetical protein